MKEKSGLESVLESVRVMETLLEDAEVCLELCLEVGEETEEGQETLTEASERLIELNEKIQASEVQRMLGGEMDLNNAILSINAGAGGTEAQDWADMLYRMYQRWVEKKGFSIEVIDFQDGEEAGIKSVTLTISGDYAYGYLKAEVGVHRLVRISPYDANKRRHTSFASVSVYPEISGDIDVEILDADLRVDTYRASGAGGQHINKTDSAVRLTHLPTGIVVQCQNQRSQHKNRATAMGILKARLYEQRLREEKEKMTDLHDDKKEIGWGSQIRSYVMQPYQMVKDHRTDTETGNVDAVLDGDIDRFIEAYLLM